jgi:hypothetical protein
MRRVSRLFLIACAVFQIGCGAAATTSSSSTPLPAAGVIVSVSPSLANVRAGDTQQFTVIVTGTSNKTVNWTVNGVAGGNATVGTLNSSGLYSSPAALPSPATVTIIAASAADSSAKSSSTITLLNPIPVLASINPSSFATGAFNLTVTGSKFTSGAKVLFAGAPLNTSFVSSNQLTVSGTASFAGTFAIMVSNPDPGSSVSGAVNVTVGSGGGNPPVACAAMSLGQGASVNGFLPFPADNAWNQDISGAAPDPNSAAIINFIGANIAIHPDFGVGQFSGQSIGIPYVVVGAQQAPVDINFTAFGSESDAGPMPVPPDAPIEGFPNPGNGDRHVLVLDNSNCWLYELYSSFPAAGGSWNAGSSAVWDLLADENRPFTWTSADAAGLPIFPGLARYDEAASGQIKHALRFTLQSSRAAFVPPASHWASNSSNALAPPMGMRLRLKSSFNIAPYSALNQTILKALKQYGMIMADNGSSMYLSGAPDDRWDNNDLHLLGNLHASDFEVILMNPIYTASNVPQGAAPVIATFTANPSTTTAGSSGTLSWNSSGASYSIITPQIGAVRGASVTVAPAQTTTYTLAATNQFGRTTASVTVTVH